MDSRNRVRVNSASNYKPKSRIGLIIGIVILTIIVIVLLVILIILLLRNRTANKPDCSNDADCTGTQICFNEKCVSCAYAPNPPKDVEISYDSSLGTATVSWTQSPTAIGYRVYRKLEDPSVGIDNYDNKSETSSTSKDYTDLEFGTHYFSVSAYNNCGESPTGIPVVLAPSCSAVPAIMPAPVINPVLNDCGGLTNSDRVQLTYADQFNTNGIYVVEGTDQVGDVSSYYFITNLLIYPILYLKCGGVETQHTVRQITNVQPATINITGPILSAGSTFTMTWNPIVGAEKYAVMVLGATDDGAAHYYGGFADGSDSSLTLNTNPGDTLIFGAVYGFKICDMSDKSPVTVYTTSP